MRVAIDHLFATVPNPLLDCSYRRSCHDRVLDPVIVWSKYSSVHSRRFALVVFEQTAQSLSASHLPLLPIQR